MGWGTSFKTDIYLSRIIFNNKIELEDKIKENKEYISKLIQKLKMFASANPKDIIDLEWKEEPINWISNQIDNLMESIEEFSYENYRLELYLDYINDKCDSVIEKQLEQYWWR